MDWTKVVTEPLGLVGFALALVFGVLGARRGAPRGLLPVGIALAAACMVGAFALAWQRGAPPTPVPPAAAPSPPAAPAYPPGQAETRGDCAPALAGVVVSGNLEIKPECGPKPRADKTKSNSK